MSDNALAGLIAEASGDDAVDVPKTLARFDPVLGVQLDELGNPVPAKPGRRGRSIDRRDFKLDTRSVFAKDPALLHGPLVTRDADGNEVHLAGKKELPIVPRQTYRRGTYWVVAGPGVRMEAMCKYGNDPQGKPIWSGWSRRLPEGTIVECLGWRKYQGTVAPQFTYPDLPAEAKVSSVWPHDGLWRPWPLQGILVPATEEQIADYLQRTGRA